jgi:signal transduction histidine kinase
VSEDVQYVQRVSRFRSVGQKYWFDLLGMAEGLTNALKHAHAGTADVTVQYHPDELELEVRDDATGHAASDGLGHGLVGIRERVKIYGGEMTAGTENGGGFVLSTRLPLSGDRR